LHETPSRDLSFFSLQELPKNRTKILAGDSVVKALQQESLDKKMVLDGTRICLVKSSLM
jgi:hypothetical protein